MKCCVKKFAFAKTLLLCLIVILLSSEAWAEPMTVKLSNKTDKKIFVALAQISSGGEDDGDKVKGWFAVNPGKTRTVKFGSYTPVNEYYYYAMSNNGKREWSGKGRDAPEFWVHPVKAFDIHPDRKISGGKKVRFRHFEVSTSGKARINLKISSSNI